EISTRENISQRAWVGVVGVGGDDEERCLQLDSADIGRHTRRARKTALIDGEHSRRARIYGRRADQRRHGLRATAVVTERGELRLDVHQGAVTNNGIVWTNVEE